MTIIDLNYICIFLILMRFLRVILTTGIHHNRDQSEIATNHKYMFSIQQTLILPFNVYKIKFLRVRALWKVWLRAFFISLFLRL